MFREANKCADLLAKRGCSLIENFVVFDTSPFDELNVLLEADRNGLYYYRHIANTLATWPFCNCFCCLYKYLVNQKKKKKNTDKLILNLKKNLNWLHTTVKPEPPTLFVRYFFRDAMFNDTCKTAALA